MKNTKIDFCGGSEEVKLKKKIKDKITDKLIRRKYCWENYLILSFQTQVSYTCHKLRIQEDIVEIIV